MYLVSLLPQITNLIVALAALASVFVAWLTYREIRRARQDRTTRR